MIIKKTEPELPVLSFYVNNFEFCFSLRFKLINSGQLCGIIFFIKYKYLDELEYLSLWNLLCKIVNCFKTEELIWENNDHLPIITWGLLNITVVWRREC